MKWPNIVSILKSAYLLFNVSRLERRNFLQIIENMEQTAKWSIRNSVIYKFLHKFHCYVMTSGNDSESNVNLRDQEWSEINSTK